MKAIYILIVSELEEDRVVLDGQIPKLLFFNEYKFVKSMGEAILELNVRAPSILMVDSTIVSFESMKSLYSTISKELLPLIVFSTQAKDAVECYKAGIAVDFLLKPFQFERLELAIMRAILKNLPSQTTLDQNYIFLKIGRIFKKFLYDDIIYVEGYGIYAKIMTPRGKITINDSIMSLGDKLYNKKFVRVHKSFIINTSKVVALKSGVLEMEIGEVPIGTHYKSSLEGFFHVAKKSNLPLKD